MSEKEDRTALRCIAENRAIFFYDSFFMFMQKNGEPNFALRNTLRAMADYEFFFSNSSMKATSAFADSIGTAL
jgi:aconitase B